MTKTAWNSGLTSKDDSKILAGEKHPNYGIKRCFNTGRTHFKKGYIPWNKGRKGTASQKSIEALVDYVKENGPWNKKYDDPNEKFAVYRDKHKEKIRSKARRHYHRWAQKYHAQRQVRRKEMIDILGGHCVKCGIDDIRVLQIDHINGGGIKEIRHHSQEWLYKRVIKSFQKGENKYQLLCANCNWIKKWEKNEHPYRRDKN